MRYNQIKRGGIFAVTTVTSGIAIILCLNNIIFDNKHLVGVGYVFLGMLISVLVDW